MLNDRNCKQTGILCLTNHLCFDQGPLFDQGPRQIRNCMALAEDKPRRLETAGCSCHSRDSIRYILFPTWLASLEVYTHPLVFYILSGLICTVAYSYKRSRGTRHETRYEVRGTRGTRGVSAYTAMHGGLGGSL